MRAWIVDTPGPIDGNPLRLIERDTPTPRGNEVRVAVSTCGVCRTDLHLAAGELFPKHPSVIPGHEIVGHVDALGPSAAKFEIGERIGIPWLRHTDARCKFCRRGDENLCLHPKFTGWDEDGGYSEYAVVDEDYAYRIPDQFDDEHAAPLLCAGIIGYRALQRASLPHKGRLGIYGFGGSAHLTAQIAIAFGATVHVMTRSERDRRHALELGAASAQGAYDAPPEQLDSAILFAPVGELVPFALEALDAGGTLAIAGIHLSDLPPLNYEHHLFHEREIRSVTANTRADGEAFFKIAADIAIKTTTVPYAFDRADQAMRDLLHDRFAGAAVLHMNKRNTSNRSEI